ncbi:MAG: DUF2892 domain-containing protein [Planctomycetales bacterium]|nr:DUF2892 domain-containing protein [Planctomycetales bacterium]
MSSVPCISVEELAKEATRGPIHLIDVRTPAEFDAVHATVARNVPLDRLDPGQVRVDRNGSAQAPLYVICRSGARSAKACEKLLQDGHENVFSVAGGTDAWVASGMPIVRGRQMLSLERQVRIVIGASVLLFAVLALFVDQRWAAMCGAMGAGLAYAGVTDCCAMAMIVAKMPWNRGTSCNGKSCSAS